MATAPNPAGVRWGISFVRKKGEARELVPGLFCLKRGGDRDGGAAAKTA